jgi:hypothetical protein
MNTSWVSWVVGWARGQLRIFYIPFKEQTDIEAVLDWIREMCPPVGVQRQVYKDPHTKEGSVCPFPWPEYIITKTINST